MEKFVLFLKKHRKLITLLIIVFSIAIMLSPFLFYKSLPLLNKNFSKIQVVEILSQILASFFIVVGSFIAVFQYYITSSSEMVKLGKDKITKAIDLAEFYKEKILTPYSAIRNIYKKTGIFDLLKKEKTKMISFDEEELKNIFSDIEISNIQKTFNSEEFFNALIITNEIANLKINGCVTTIETDGEGEKHVKISVNLNKALNDFHTRYISALLNNIELFAMYFTHEVADESVVYQSLFPTYIEMCQVLYYDISICSANGGPKLYRNLQCLYQTWLKKCNNDKERIKKDNINMGTISKNIK